MSYSSKNSGGVKPHKGTNLIQIYGGKNNTTSKITGNTKLGSLQSTSKVNGSIRRLPNIATLPSLKSESSGSELTPISSSGNNGWNKQQTLKKNSTTNKVSDLRPRWAKVSSTPSNDYGAQVNGHQENTDINSSSLSNAPLKEFPSLADSVGKIKNGNDDGNSLFPEAPPPSTAIGGYIRAKPVSYKNERKLPDRYCATTKPSYGKSEKFDLNKKLAEVRVEEERRKKEETKNCHFSDDQKGDEKENSEITSEDSNNFKGESQNFDNPKETSFSEKFSNSNDKLQNGYESYGYSSKNHFVKTNDMVQNYQYQDDKHDNSNESPYEYGIEKNNTCHPTTNTNTSGSFLTKNHGTVRIAKRGEDFGQCHKNLEDDKSELRPITSIIKNHDNECTKNNTKITSCNEKHSTKLLQNIVDIDKKADRKDPIVKPATAPPINIWAKRAEEREQAEKERLKQLELLNAAEHQDKRQKTDYNNKISMTKIQNDSLHNSSKSTWKNKELNKKFGSNNVTNENITNYRSSKRYSRDEGYNNLGKRLENKKSSEEKEFDSFKRYGNVNSICDKSTKNFIKGGNRSSYNNKGRNIKQHNSSSNSSKKHFEGIENVEVDSDSSEVINYGRLNKDGVKATYYKREDNFSEKQKKVTQSEKVWNNNKESSNNYKNNQSNNEVSHQKIIDDDKCTDNNKIENQINLDNDNKIEDDKYNSSMANDAKGDNSGKKEISEQDIENLKKAVGTINDGNSSPIPTTWSNGDNFDECLTMKQSTIRNSLDDTIGNQLDCSNNDSRINYDSTNGPFSVDSMNDIFGFPGNTTSGFEASFSSVNKNTSSKGSNRQQIQDSGRVQVQPTNLQQTNMTPPVIQQQDSIGIHPSQGGMDVFGYNQMNMLMPNDLFGRPFQTQYTNYGTNAYSQGSNVYYDPRQNNQWNSTTNGNSTYNTTNTDTLNNRSTTTNNSRNNVGNQQSSTNYSQQVGNRQQRNNNNQQQQFHFMPTFSQYPGHDYFRNQPAPPNVTMNYAIQPTDINSSTHPYNTIMPPMLGSQNYQPNQYQFPPPIHASQQVQGGSGYNNSNQRSSHGRQNNSLDDFSNWNMFLSSPNMVPSSQILPNNRGNGQNLHYTSSQQNSVGSRQNFLNNNQNSGNQRNHSINNRGNTDNNSSNRWNSTNNSSNNGNKHTH
ncbi:BAT2, N-terminal domain-containing protein [Strongyloides ratti]|uniref:BAT2, N-terminal domain-containing protein n=1 Tax=Strongyloides ratti TaxID=34506 RepID=A0A090MW47_STRRB|nr:BAT2, N-terminal domain-containing protein [Strongyloides ratti]CEF63413.1 BAT2, N-terminal domain-containing protein [Strongyloides ratti]